MAKKARKNHYFTKVHEQAIIDYCSTDDQKLRNDLYKEFIGPVFDEMVDKIVFTYKFTNLPNIDALREDCKNWLITVLNKFDATKGSKAFTYFSVVSKNWFIAQVKKTSKRAKREIHLEDYYIASTNSDNSAGDLNSNLIVHNPYTQEREKFEFFSLLKNEVDLWLEMPLRSNERKTIQAIQILFEDSENIEIFNKKAIYLYIREITGLNTKQVVSSLNKIRKKYREFKKEWDND
tara:strand:+ start:4484 stop:5188 length:705 start_codon:yes stop_codon:yes gene_type:complete